MPPTGGMFPPIRGNTDNHLLLQITAAALPDTKNPIPKTPPVPLMEIKCSSVVTVEKAQMFKPPKMSLFCTYLKLKMLININTFMREVTDELSAAAGLLILELNSPYGSSQDQ